MAGRYSWGKQTIQTSYWRQARAQHMADRCAEPTKRRTYANIDKPFTSLNGAACPFIILSKLTTIKPNPAVRVGPNLWFPRVINFKSLLRPHQRYCITQCEKRGFSWLTHMKDNYTTKILTSSLTRFSSKGWENVCFELGNERVVGKVNCRRIYTVWWESWQTQREEEVSCIVVFCRLWSFYCFFDGY